MAAAQAQKLAGLQRCLKDHPHIPIAAPSTPEYTSLREIFCLDNREAPLAIVRPQSATDVSLLLRYAASNGIKTTVRAGGHNLFGRSQAEGALTIDMRDIKSVEVLEGNASARVGGGILQKDLTACLSKTGLVTPIGSVSSVGYVGWATYGGYGPFSANFGLGLDQLLGATIVNWQGEVVEADGNLMRGIRGAGGAFGIIVDVTIKVYPLQKVLAGDIIYESLDIKTTFENFNAGYRTLSAEGLPLQLTVQQKVVNPPSGRVMALGFMWSSEDFATGMTWLAKFEALGSVLMNTVTTRSIPDWLKESSAHVPTKLFGTSHTHSLREIDGKISAVISHTLERMPSDPGAMFSIHELRGLSAHADSESVFGSRQPHFMLEILGFSTIEENRGGSIEWAAEMWEAISHIDSATVLPQAYISLDHPSAKPDHIPLSRVYGVNDKDVLALKQKYDPENIFELAVPRLKDYRLIL